MMILIIGFTCPSTIHFKFITECASVITKCDDHDTVRQNRVLSPFVGTRYSSGSVVLDLRAVVGSDGNNRG